MRNRTKALILGGVIAVGSLAAGAAVAGTRAEPASDIVDAEDVAEGPDVPITGDALETASRVALDIVGDGRVTATEVGDEESYYEVEITLPDGSQVDVQLDEDFGFVGYD